MVETTILQHWIFTDFLFPFFLVFFLTFAILERTKLLGDGKKSINAWISVVIGLIFVGAIYPKIVVGKLTLFLSVALVALFVIMLIWGFILGDYKALTDARWVKYPLAGIAAIAFIGGLLWATGWYSNVTNFFNGSGVGQDIISNVFIVGIIVAVLVLVLKPAAKS